MGQQCAEMKDIYLPQLATIMATEAMNITEKYLRLSMDDGRTWPFRRALEEAPDGSFSYPSILQSRDGRIHVTYSAAIPAGETIRHAELPLEWLRAANHQP